MRKQDNTDEESIYIRALHDTLMFLFGVSLGIVLNFIFKNVGGVDRPWLFIFVVGLVQIYINSLVSHQIHDTFDNSGLLFLGLLLPQTLLFKGNFKKGVLATD